MPSAAERVCVIRDSSTQTDGTKCGDSLEEDGIQVESWRWDRECVALDDADKGEAVEDPPSLCGYLFLEVSLAMSAYTNFPPGKAMLTPM